MLKPIDIQNKDFEIGFRGYKRDEVDDFLDQIINDYEMLYRDNSRLQKELELNNKQLDQYHQLEKNLQDTLQVAQRTAAELESTAKKRGEEIRQTAKEEAENVKREAELQAERLRQQTEQECKRKVAKAAAKVQAAVEEYERLVRERRQFVVRMRNLMQTELGLLEDAYDIMPDKISQQKPEDKKPAEAAQDENLHFEAEQERDAEQEPVEEDKAQVSQ